MYLIYANEFGTISMGSKNSAWKITKVKGLNVPEKSHSVIRYGTFGGQETIYSMVNSRIITISGDFYSEDIQKELTKAARIFNSKGKLSVISNDKQRLIECNQIVFNELDRKGPYVRFNLQFICDNPYFYDLFPTATGVFERIGTIEDAFTLPCTFSTRSNNNFILNAGDVNSEPIFNIFVEDVNGVNNNDDTGYKISNLTTNQSIWLKYQAVEGEKIVIDIFNRSITSSIEGNIITNISNDTFLNDFFLARGENNINVVNYNANETIKIECIHNNSYIEAVC